MVGASWSTRAGEPLHALFVTRDLPVRDSATIARPWHLLSLLVDSGYNVDVLSLQTGGASTDTSSDEPTGIRVQSFKARTVAPWRRVRARHDHGPTPEPQPDLTAAAAELIDDTSLVVCTDALCHSYVRDLLWPMARPPFCLIDLSEPESARHVTAAKSASTFVDNLRGPFRGWHMRARAEMLRQLEAAAAFQADLVLVSNLIDLQILAERAAGANLWLVGDGVNLPSAAEPPGPPRDTDHCNIMLAGDLRQHDHQRAAAWLVQVVWPMVRQTCSNATLHIIAPQLSRPLRRAARQGLVVWERADPTPALWREVAQRCTACLAPQRQARGAAEGVLQAMAMGLPCICTHTVVATLPMGLATAPIVADRASEIAGAVTTILRDPHEAARRAAASRTLIEDHATWSAQWSRVSVLLADLAAKRSPRLGSDVIPPQQRRPPAARIAS